MKQTEAIIKYINENITALTYEEEDEISVLVSDFSKNKKRKERR